MQKIRFEEAVNLIRKRDQRFDKDAYFFLRDCLDFTVKRQQSDDDLDDEMQHVDGTELLQGVRDYALKEYGPMAYTVLESWGVKKGDDIGSMVFHLIDVGAFGKSADDSPEDFVGILDLEEELSAPFRPRNEVAGEISPRRNQPATSSEA